MVESESIIVAAVSESCIAEKTDFSRAAVCVKDVLLMDDASFDFSGDFSLLLTETASGAWPERADDNDDDCDSRNREEPDDEVFITDEESLAKMSAMGLPTTFVTNSELKTSKDIRKENRSSRRKNRKAMSFFHNPSSSQHTFLRQHKSYESNEEGEFRCIWDSSSQGFAEDLPICADSALAFPAQNICQELSIDKDMVIDEGGPADLIQNPEFEGLDNIHHVSRDVVNELDGDSNHKLVVSPWVRCWDHQSSSSYFFNSKTLETTWEPPEVLEECIFLPVNKCNKDSQDDLGNEACGKRVEKAMESRLSNVQQVSEKCIGNLNREGNPFPWVRCWDNQYGRYYFCNSKTLETTWELPDGLEPWFCSSAVEVEDSRAMEDDAETEGSGKLDGDGVELELLFCRKAGGSKANEVLQACKPCAHLICSNIDKSVEIRVHSGGTTKALTGEKHTKGSSKLMMKGNYHGSSSSALRRNHSSSVYKYWIQRFHLFSKFNAGVKLDEEGWFSVTPEIIAKHQAARCNHGLIIDAFTGVGGNAIQFALAGHYVIAIDNDPRKIEYAQHNARIYGIADRIDFLLGDFCVVSSSLQADVVFLSPPWGGPEYLEVDVYDIQTMLQPKDGMSLLSMAQAIAPNVIFFLPRNVNVNQLAELSQKSTPHLACEVERNFLNGKLKAVTAYYGQFACLD